MQEYRRKYPGRAQETSKRSYAKHRAAQQQMAREKYQRQKVYDPAGLMLHRKRYNALRAGIPFSLTRADINIPEYCPALGIRLAGVGSGDHDAAPSIDRIIPELGYVPGNVRVISNRANMLRGNGSSAEHRSIADWLEKSGQ